MDLLTRAVSTGQFRNLLDVVQRVQEVCSMCDARNDELFMCPCRQAFYCSTACQLQHWKVHKQLCTEAQRGPAKLRTCFCCGKTSFNLFMCRCGIAVYCDVTCQRKHWGRHRNVCSTYDPPRSKMDCRSGSGTGGRLRKFDKATQTDPLMFTTTADSDANNLAGDSSSDPNDYARFGNPLSGVGGGGSSSLPDAHDLARYTTLTTSSGTQRGGGGGGSYETTATAGVGGNSLSDLGVGGALVHLYQTAYPNQATGGSGGSGNPLPFDDNHDDPIGWSGRRREASATFGPDTGSVSLNPLLHPAAAAAAAAAAAQSLRSATQGGGGYAAMESRSSFRHGGAPRATALVRQGTVLQSVMSTTEAHLARSKLQRSYRERRTGGGGGGSNEVGMGEKEEENDDAGEEEELVDSSSDRKASQQSSSFATRPPIRRRTMAALQLQLRQVLLDEESERAVLSQAQRDLRSELVALSSRSSLKIASTELGEMEAKGRLEVLTNFNLWVVRQAKSAWGKLQRLRTGALQPLAAER